MSILVSGNQVCAKHLFNRFMQTFHSGAFLLVIQHRCQQISFLMLGASACAESLKGDRAAITM